MYVFLDLCEFQPIYNSDTICYADCLCYLRNMAVNDSNNGNDRGLLVDAHLQTRRLHAADVWLNPGMLRCNNWA